MISALPLRRCHPAFPRRSLEAAPWPLPPARSSAALRNAEDAPSSRTKPTKTLPSAAAS
jgi:hypothetical protein